MKKYTASSTVASPKSTKKTVTPRQKSVATVNVATVAAQPAPIQAHNFGESEIISVPLDMIDLAPKSEQARPFDPQDAEYIRKVEWARTNRKWLAPLIVRKSDKAGRFTLVAGRNRFQASKETGWKVIEVRVFSDLDPGAALEIGLIENLRNKPMTKTEIAAAVASIINRRRGITVNDLAREMNCTPNTVRNYLSLNNLTTEAQKLVSKGDIPAANAYALAQLPIEVQAENDGAWIKSAIETKTLKFVKAVQEFVKDLKTDRTGEARKGSAERARSASRAAKPLTQTELEAMLDEAREGNQKVIGKVNESYQDGLIDMALIALGKKPLLPASRMVGYSPKPASPRKS